jgi:hypothetical protein
LRRLDFAVEFCPGSEHDFPIHGDILIKLRAESSANSVG